jgi:hypothetical protein
VDSVLLEDLDKLPLLEAQAVRCGSSKKGACLATWQTEIHGGIAEWDRQSEVPFLEQLLSDVPFLEQLLSDVPSRKALRMKTCEKSWVKHLVPRSHLTHSWLCQTCFCPDQKQDSKTRPRNLNEPSWVMIRSLCSWIRASWSPSCPQG